MCRCCHSIGGTRRYATDLEPVAIHSFDDSFERDLTSVQLVKGKCHDQHLNKFLNLILISKI